MRADRLIALVLLLQARGRLTADDLAARLEVSPRTVYRDLDALSAAGVPVYAAAGRGGGISLPEGYRLDLTALNPAEARALFLGGVAAPLADLGAGAVLDAALRKLSAALPAASRDAAARARERLLVDPSDWWQPAPPPPPHLPVIEEAVWRGRRLRLTYARYRRPPAERLVDPYALVAKRGVWYLVGAVAGEGPLDGAASAQSASPPAGGGRLASGATVQDSGPSTRHAAPGARVRAAERSASGGEPGPAVFRVSRVRRAVLTDEPSRRPADFDLPRFWAAWGEAFLASRPSYPATVRATPQVAAGLARTFARGAAPAPAAPPDDTGRVVVEVDLQTLEIACHTLLGYGPDAEALAPAQLRERLARLAGETAARYRSAVPQG